MTKKGKVWIETGGETPRGYHVGKKDEITIRTKSEKPDISFGDKSSIGEGCNPIGCLILLIIAFFILYKAVDYTVNLVEVNVVKKINPNYKTRYEIAEEKKKEIRKKREERIKRRTQQAELQQLYEAQNEKIKDAVGGSEKIEKNLQQKGFRFYSSDYFYAIDNYVWNGGSLVLKKTALPFQAKICFQLI